MLAALLGLAFTFALVPGVPPNADALSWMAGSWTGSQDGLEMEEVWTAPRGGSLLGIHRDVKAGKMVEFEFLRIDASDGTLTYWASPQGRPVTPFRVAEVGKDRVVFENSQHDYPTRVLYWGGGSGALHAKIEGKLRGQPSSEEWTWTRAR